MEVDLAGRQFVCVTACFQYNRHIKDHEKSEKPAFSFAAQTGWCTDVIENQGPVSDCVAKYQLDEDCFGRKKRVWAALCERRTQSWQRLWQSKWRQLVCGGWCTCYRDLDNMRLVALYIDIESFEPQKQLPEYTTTNESQSGHFSLHFDTLQSNILDASLSVQISLPSLKSFQKIDSLPDS